MRWSTDRGSTIDPSRNIHITWFITLAALAWSGASSARARFIRQPSNLTVSEGSLEVIMQCHVENVERSVRWSKNSFVLPSLTPPIKIGGSVYSIQPEQPDGVYNLRIQNVSIKDDGIYECQALGSSVKLRSRRAFLNVLVAPKTLVILPAVHGVISVKHDRTMTIRCEASDSKPAPLITWRIGQKEIIRSISQRSITRSKLVQASSSLTLTPSRSQNGTVIECLATHPSSDQVLSKTAILSVLYPPGEPVITGHEGKQLISGHIVALTCTSTGGNPAASLEWKIDGVVVPSETLMLNDGSSSQLSYSLTSESDGKLVTCAAKNQALEAPLLARVILVVQYPPKAIEIAQYPASGVFENSSVTLSCTASRSNPRAGLTWYHNGKPITTDQTEATRARVDVNSPVESSIALNHVSRVHARSDYICRASVPELDFVREMSTRINVIYPPSTVDITLYHLQHDSDPQTTDSNGVARKFRAGETIQLKCISKGGNPRPLLRWYSNDLPVEDENDHVVHMKSSEIHTGCMDSDTTCSAIEIKLRASDNQRAFECRSSHLASNVEKRSNIQLKVMFAPSSVAIEMFPTAVHNNQRMSLTCDTTSSFPAPVINWYHNGMLITQSTAQKLSGVVTSTTQPGSNWGFTSSSRLILLASSEYHGSSITCRATNLDLGQSVEKVVKLNIRFRPIVQSDTTVRFNATESSVVRISLPVRANPTNLTFRWWRLLPRDESTLVNKLARLPKALEDAGSLTQWLKTPLLVNERVQWSSTEGVLRILGAQPDDAGLYRVDVENSVGSTSVNVVFDVFYPARVVQMPKPPEAKEGEDVTLTCEFETHPRTKANVKWTKEIPTPIRKSYQEYTKNHRSILVLKNVTSNDRGVYRCAVDNGVGEAAVETVRLFVKFGAKIDRTKSTRKVARPPPSAGEISAALVCTATGNPPVQFEWKEKNGSKIVASKLNSHETGYVIDEALFADEVQTSKLFVNTKVVHEEEDLVSLFYCSASNSLGQDQMRMLVVPRGSPDPPSDVKVENITDTALAVSWEPGFDGGSTQTFVVRYKTHAEETQEASDKEKWSEISLPSSRTVCKIENLLPGEAYSVRIRSTNALGQSKLTHALRVKTTKTTLSSSETGVGLQLAANNLPIFISAAAILIVAVILLFIFVPRCRKGISYKPKSVNTESEGLPTPNASLTGSEGITLRGRQQISCGRGRATNVFESQDLLGGNLLSTERNDLSRDPYSADGISGVNSENSQSWLRVPNSMTLHRTSTFPPGVFCDYRAGSEEMPHCNIMHCNSSDFRPTSSGTSVSSFGHGRMRSSDESCIRRQEPGIGYTHSDAGSAIYPRSYSLCEDYCCAVVPNNPASACSHSESWDSCELCSLDRNRHRSSILDPSAAPLPKRGATLHHYHTLLPRSTKQDFRQGNVQQLANNREYATAANERCYTGEDCVRGNLSRSCSSSSFLRSQERNIGNRYKYVRGLLESHADGSNSESDGMYAVDVGALTGNVCRNRGSLGQAHGLYVLGVDEEQFSTNARNTVMERHQQLAPEMLYQHAVPPLSVREGLVAPPGVRNSWVSSSSSESDSSNQKMILNQQQFIEMIERGSSSRHDNHSESVSVTPLSDQPVSISMSSSASSTKPLLSARQKMEKVKGNSNKAVAPLPPPSFQDSAAAVTRTTGYAFDARRSCVSEGVFVRSRDENKAQDESTAFLGVDEDGTLFV